MLEVSRVGSCAPSPEFGSVEVYAGGHRAHRGLCKLVIPVAANGSELHARIHLRGRIQTGKKFPRAVELGIG